MGLIKPYMNPDHGICQKKTSNHPGKNPEGSPEKWGLRKSCFGNLGITKLKSPSFFCCSSSPWLKQVDFQVEIASLLKGVFFFQHFLSSSFFIGMEVLVNEEDTEWTNKHHQTFGAVDGRNPKQPPGMYKNVYIMGKTSLSIGWPDLLNHQQTVVFFF